MDPREAPTVAPGILNQGPAAPDPASATAAPSALPQPSASQLGAEPPPPAAASADPLLGTTVAERYRLLEKLGEGGMGAVYRGEHVSLRKSVAVKFLHAELSSNKDLVARFEREAIAAANLDHPNIVAATDFGRLPDGTFFLVMEFVEGPSLRRLLASNGRLEPARALRILRQIGAALARAHGMGIVHRDLKPDNVVVCERDGERDVVKVIDFGIARVTGALGAGGAALTQAGMVFGTPQYMAPEQAMGQPVDGQADQYALGVIAFELFTGRPPFAATEMIELIQMHLTADVPRVTATVPDLPPALDAAVARMLAKLPRDRFESVAQAIDAVEAALGPLAQAAAVAPAPPLGLAQTWLPSPGATGAVVPSQAVPTAAPWVVGAAAPAPARFGRPAVIALALVGLLLISVGVTFATRGPHPVAAGPTVHGAAAGAGGSDSLAALVHEALNGSTPEARASAARRARAHAAQLSEVDRARVALRAADSCEELAAAVQALTTLDDSAAREDLGRIHAGDCEQVARRSVCRQCVRGGGHGDDEPGASEPPPDEPSRRGRGHGHGRGHGRFLRFP